MTWVKTHLHFFHGRQCNFLAAILLFSILISSCGSNLFSDLKVSTDPSYQLEKAKTDLDSKDFALAEAEFSDLRKTDPTSTSLGIYHASSICGQLGIDLFTLVERISASSNAFFVGLMNLFPTVESNYLTRLLEAEKILTVVVPNNDTRLLALSLSLSKLGLIFRSSAGDDSSGSIKVKSNFNACAVTTDTTASTITHDETSQVLKAFQSIVSNISQLDIPSLNTYTEKITTAQFDLPAMPGSTAKTVSLATISYSIDCANLGSRAGGQVVNDPLPLGDLGEALLCVALRSFVNQALGVNHVCSVTEASNLYQTVLIP